MSIDRWILSCDMKGGQLMIWKLWKRWKALRDRRRSMEWMLKRKDDRWLNDIGLTRNDLRVLLEEWEE